MAAKKATTKKVSSKKTPAKKTATRKTAAKPTTKAVKEAVAKAPVTEEKNTSTPKSFVPEISQRQGFIIVAIIIAAAILYYFRGMFIAATVDGTPISRLKVIQQLEKDGGQQILDGLITQELIKKEAANQGMSITEEEINTRIDELRASLESQGQNLDEILATQGTSLSEVKDQIRIQVIAEKLLADKVEVTDEEIDEYLETNADFLPEDQTPEELRETAREGLRSQKLSQEFQKLIQELRASANIQYLSDIYEPVL